MSRESVANIQMAGNDAVAISACTKRGYAASYLKMSENNLDCFDNDTP